MIVERLKMAKILKEARKTNLDTTSKDYTKKIKTYSSEAEKKTPSKASVENVSEDIEIIEIPVDSSNQPCESLNESCQVEAVVEKSLPEKNKLKRKISEMSVIEIATPEKAIDTNKKINKICLPSKKASNNENNATQANKTLPLMSSLSCLNNLSAFNLTSQVNQQQSSFLINNNNLGQIMKIPLQPQSHQQQQQQQQPAFVIPPGFQGTILFQPTIHVHTNNKNLNLTNYRKIIPKK